VYRQILNTEPTHDQALYGLGHVLGTEGDHRQAAECFGALAAKSPQSVNAWLCLGIAQQSLNDHSAAIESFGRATDLDPGLNLARYALGRSLLVLQRTDEAAQAFTLVLENGSPAPAETALRAKARRQLQQLRTAKPLYILKKPEREKPVIQPSLPLGLTNLLKVPRPATASRSTSSVA
ncbi:MAG: tetratricopeptide repeat protein, partial [Mesorhizobium sp.]